MNQRVLVLGGSGYVGRHVAGALAKAGAGPVIVAARRLPTYALSPGIEALRLDATDERLLGRAMADVDWVVNCVSGDSTRLHAGAVALARAARRAQRAPGIVHLSSMAVYGQAEGVVDEHAPLDGRPGGYAAAKLASERALSELPRRVILRPGCIYGRGSPQWSLRIAELLRSGRIGALGAAGQGRCNLVHIDDVAAAVVAAIRTPGALGEHFNLAIADPPTWNAYFALYARALGLTPARVPAYRLWLDAHLAGPLLAAGHALARRADTTTTVPKPIPASLLRLWRQAIVLDSRKAADVLGLRATPLEYGVAASADAADLRTRGAPGQGCAPGWDQ
ncbi:capsular biosynthesis protein [Lysobacteraceae bacterium NML93-0399]|nr:capsular biosynthesis protein [Xanthomonadaceae bacterium NML93-0399]